MSTPRILALTLSILALAACGEEASPPVPETPPAVAEAPTPEPEPAPVSVGTVAAPSADELAQATETGALARNVLRDPTQAESLLGAAGLTAETFETRVYAIARNPVLSDAYRVALETP